jgi:hypothetical protein
MEENFEIEYNSWAFPKESHREWWSIEDMFYGMSTGIQIGFTANLWDRV